MEGARWPRPPKSPWGRLGVLAVLLLLVNLQVTPAAAATFELTELWSHTIPGAEVTAVALAPGGNLVAAGTDGNILYLFTRAGVEVWNKSLGPLPDPVNGTGFPDDSHLYAFSNSTLYLYGTDGTLLGTFTNASTEPILAAKATVSGNLVAYVTPTYLFLRNISTGGLMGSWQPHAGASYKWRDVAIKEDGSTVYGLTSSGAIEAYTIAQFSLYTPTLIGNVTYLDVTLTAPGVAASDLDGYNANATLTNATIIQSGYPSNQWEAFLGYDGLQFTDPIPMYLESYDVTNHVMKIWFKLPAMVSGVSKRIYLYQNTTRTVQADLSTGWATFPAFDDFEGPARPGMQPNSTEWNLTYKGDFYRYIQVINGALEVNGSANSAKPANNPATLHGRRTWTGNITIYWNATVSSVTIPSGAGADMGMSNVSDSENGFLLAGYATQRLEFWYYSIGDPLMGYYHAYAAYPSSGAGTDWFLHSTSLSAALILMTNKSYATAYDVGKKFGGKSWLGAYDPYAPVDTDITTGNYHLDIGAAPGATLPTNGWNLSVKSVWAAKKDLIKVSESATDFGGKAGPYALGFWTYWPYFNYSATKTGFTNGQNMHLDNTEKWFSVSATGTWYAQQIDGITFGTTYSYASGSGAPTARTAISGAGSFSVEGRGAGIFDVIRLDGTRVGTYTAGGTINGVAIADNGLWAVAGSNDGIFYAFGKQSSSSWQLIDTSTPAAEVLAVALLADGSIGAAGRSDGTLTLYQVGEATTGGFSQLLHFTKDGSPAVGYSVEVEDGGVSGTGWTVITAAGLTDSNGDLVFSATAGHYYRITVDGQVSIIQASTSYPTLYLNWASPPAYPEFGSGFNVTNGTIDTFYRDPLTVPITVEIKNTDTRALAFCQTVTTNDLALSWNPPAGTHHYQVRISAERPMGAVGGQYYPTTGTGTTMELIPVQGPALQILLMIFLMVVAGLFGYVHAPVGALAVSFIAAWFNYENWLTIPWYWVQLALLVSFMAMIARGSDV